VTLLAFWQSVVHDGGHYTPPYLAFALDLASDGYIM
jgi:hypothetical protein